MNRKERFTLDAAETVETPDGAVRADMAPSVAGPVLDGIPRQPGVAAVRVEEQKPVGLAWVCEQKSAALGLRTPARTARLTPLRPWRLLPNPKATPFTFFYAAVLVLTSVVAEYADPALAYALHQGSSTDVAHLVRTPVLVLLASALWVAGGVGSPYVLGFLLVLTALERRIGGWRTAGVFLLGHVLATLATEVPVGLAVLVGHLPDTSLHRLDYGISFGVAASVGALAGLLSPWLRWPVLGGVGGMLLDDLIAFADPMTNWGHLMALAIGVATWPVVRGWGKAAQVTPGDSDGSEASAGRAQATTTAV